ncbi:putative TBP associated factor [Trichodelitschia bisporula]|uniref:TATA-binding protein-associated factor mot1 n=1 Tax=Trichodelitschia bisporula TaxID=703511 RepID=A0A6G1I5Z7_9PEZI|nr:putative TBP associated factor [Trichodelitschia bisporula]
MSATRLDRLVVLIDTGHNSHIRQTAALQLADIQKQHPDELFNLITRIIPYLRSKSWETRVAAAKALGGIVENAPLYDPNEDDDPGLITNGHSNGISNGGEEAELPLNEEQLQLETLAVQAILKNGKPLAGSAGREYDYKFAGLDATQRLAVQKKTLAARLGLGGEYIEDELISSKDLETPHPLPQDVPKIDTSVAKVGGLVGPLVVNSPSTAPPGTPTDEKLTPRQLNMLKRKKKKELSQQANKVRIVDFADRKSSVAETPQTPSIPQAIPVKSEIKTEESANGINDYFSLERTGEDDETKLVSEFKGVELPETSAFQTEAEKNGCEWPFDKLFEYLTVDLFDHAWEVRHGAAMGVREVIRVQGAGAGRVRGKTRKQNDILNRRWLDDLSCRLCCVFMLDRFGDYVSDNVVLPVRETAGQALGAVLQYSPPASVKAVFEVLRKLVATQDEENAETTAWQPCHGGILGMKYLVAVRNDLLLKEPELLDGVLNTVIQCLGNNDDDVRAVSAATLIPIAKEIVATRPAMLDELILIVWNCLSNLSDDLSASTGSVMDLLAALCSFQEVLDAMKRNASKNPELSFAQLVPRLFPFLRHTITTVRRAVLRALRTFMNIQGEGTQDWINGKALRLLFQNLLVERDEKVLQLSLEVANALVDALVSRDPVIFAQEFKPHVGALLSLTMHPIGVSRHPIPMDPTLFMRPSGQTFSLQHFKLPAANNQAEPPKKRRKTETKKEPEIPQTSAHNVDGHMMQGDVDLVGVDVLTRSKIFAAQALGKAIALWPEVEKLEVFGNPIVSGLSSSYSSTQFISAMVVEEYAKHAGSGKQLAQSLSPHLRQIVEGERPGYYSDLTSYMQVVRAQCQSLLNAFRDTAHVGQTKLPTIAPVVQGDVNASQYAFSIADAERIVSTDYERLKKGLAPAQRLTASKVLQNAKEEAEKAIEEASTIKNQRDVRVRAAAAAATVALNASGTKQALIIRGLMDSIKMEENAELQRRSAAEIAVLIDRLSAAGKQTVVRKVVNNLTLFYCMETAETPEFVHNAAMVTGILSLGKEEDVRDHADQAKFERDAKAARITRRGAKEALEQLVSTFGTDLFTRVPTLRDNIETPIRQAFTPDELPEDVTSTEINEGKGGQAVVDALSILRALVPKFTAGLHPFVDEIMPLVTKALVSKLGVFRYAAAKCFATICSVMTVSGITMLVEHVLPAISNALDVHCRQGAIECVYHLIHVMEERILPYVVFLIVPVLGRMSDSDNDVRLIATTTFATLVKLVPLEAGIPDPPGLSEKLLQGRERERQFISQMLDPKKVEDFPIPVAIRAELRPYQQDGVNWLAFLNRFNLHGILCDDMGLGKTLQTLCMVASDHHMRAEEYAKTNSPDKRPLPSVIVCPPSLSGHWQQEMTMYAPFLKYVAFVGSSTERMKNRPKLKDADIIITSYDVCRNDIDFLETLDYNYCVLDEGHLIKNAHTRATKAVKRLKSYHRLILSGTPIQNNVLELWSLFDFLMPGFLGTEKVFKDRFSKPIAASRNAKANSKEQEAGALAIEALHKQVLPFLLRRLKEEVLNDLPPKILQNYYCDLSDLQRRLFEDFHKKEGRAIADAASDSSKEGKAHIFQALQYMRKLCNSPALAVKPTHKQYDSLVRELATRKTRLDDIQHAPKLRALRDLLLDCGIGTDASAESDSNPVEAVSQHRALIFCQMKEMLDMVQQHVLGDQLKGVQYLRLDGGVEASKRQDIVNRFNNDPSYDVLLLTTSVGGLGLNLTGADTVIFVEHDWNPQKDMQAMDRAHRIGQKKVVNVYRIVTRGTLEEKILSLQRFKIDVASTVVNQQNAGLGSMQTDQILDLFNISTDAADAAPPLPAADPEKISEEDAVDATGELRQVGKRGFLDEIGDLWDEKQYEEEYNLDSFLATMKA